MKIKALKEYQKENNMQEEEPYLITIRVHTVKT